jgi:hypothetical protein
MQDKEVPERKDKKKEKRTTGQRMGMGVEAPTGDERDGGWR